MFGKPRPHPATTPGQFTVTIPRALAQSLRIMKGDVMEQGSRGRSSLPCHIRCYLYSLADRSYPGLASGCITRSTLRGRRAHAHLPC